VLSTTSISQVSLVYLLHSNIKTTTQNEKLLYLLQMVK